VVMDPNQPTHRGRDAIRAHYASFIGNPELTLASRATEIVVARSADMAYEIGTLTARIRDGEQTREIPGRYMAVWTKVNGEWLIAREMSNR
jgi:ketosteroid isomerase-like protein